MRNKQEQAVKPLKNSMGTSPILPLIAKMSLPPMLSMLIGSLYNIVDSIFVAKLGEKALTAVSLIYPLQTLALAFSVGMGIAINAICARYLGAKDRDSATSVASVGLTLALLQSLLFVIIGVFFIPAFLKFFTTDEIILNYGVQYGVIAVTFSFGQFVLIAIEKMYQAVGKMLLPMLMATAGAIINIILDPILIFGLWGFPAMGVTGAAIATVIGQVIPALIYVLMIFNTKKEIYVTLKKMRLRSALVKQLYVLAIPATLTLCLPSLLISATNSILATVSQTAVAFFGIYFKLQNFILMPANGIVQGIRPVISYNYGAKNNKRVNDTLFTAGKMIAIINTLGTLLFLLCPQLLLSMFDANPTMLNMGVTGLRILSFTFILSTASVVMSGVFEALSLGKCSLLISLVRQFVITIPAAYLLIKGVGLSGAWVAFPLGEFAGIVITAILYFTFYKKVLANNSRSTMVS
ncbi:MATE family efflux transporter [Enterococcus sp. AZ196]|uniref:MATE family efflux transporter n=1 Tax=Enterococcus sp. AZ196 TaxID=2774659 RepID=UPI003D2A2FFC